MLTMFYNLPDGVATGRDARDVGSASFAVNVYPVQVDLTEWTKKFEEKLGDFTKLVDLRFKALNSLVNGNFYTLLCRSVRPSVRPLVRRSAIFSMYCYFVFFRLGSSSRSSITYFFQSGKSTDKQGVRCMT